MQRFRALTLALVATTALSGCMERLGNVGRPPQLSSVRQGELPSTAPNKETGLPGAADSGRRFPDAADATPERSATGRASLWRPGVSLVRDQRAMRAGDILTVTFDIEDSANLENETTQSRSSNEQMGLGAFFGYEQSLAKVLPEAVNSDELASASGERSYSGEGETDREEEIEFEMAAMVVDVLPNGHFVIRGRQEIRVNYELRDLQVSGIVRPADVGSNNTVSYRDIAEVRVSYGGRGLITNAQQPRYGQQILDVILPW